MSFSNRKSLHYLVNSLAILIKAKFVRRSCNTKGLKHAFINFNFENDLSQLDIENSMARNNPYAIHNVGKTFLPNYTKHSSACLELEETALFLARRSIQKSIIFLYMYTLIAATSLS